MTSRMAILIAALVPLTLASPLAPVQAEGSGQRQTFDNGLVRVKSAHGFAQTIERLKGDVAAKGITFFFAVDQARLAGEAAIMLRPSTLLVFGNPGLGSQFMTSNPLAGIDWPVRLLVVEDERGEVWAVYNDFHYLARRHDISDRNGAFDKASEVIASITSAVAM